MKRFVRPDKKKAFKEYTLRSNDLTEQLATGKLTQEQFERAHDLLDEQYWWLR